MHTHQHHSTVLLGAIKYPEPHQGLHVLAKVLLHRCGHVRLKATVWATATARACVRSSGAKAARLRTDTLRHTSRGGAYARRHRCVDSTTSHGGQSVAKHDCKSARTQSNTRRVRARDHTTRNRPSRTAGPPATTRWLQALAADMHTALVDAPREVETGHSLVSRCNDSSSKSPILEILRRVILAWLNRAKHTSACCDCFS